MYFEQNVDYFRKSFCFISPIYDMGFVASICTFIDALLYHNTKENMEALKVAPPEDQKIIYEAYFIFAVMWSIG